MKLGAERFEALMETITNGGRSEAREACDELMRLWKDAPVHALLALKEQFRKLDMESREAALDEALISIAERRPEPFTAIATDPSQPLWRQAVDVLAMLGGEAYLDLFISLLPLCPRRNLKDLAAAIGCFRGAKVAEALSPYLDTDDEALFQEVVLALKRSGAPEAVELMKARISSPGVDASDKRSFIEAVIREMEE